MSYNLPVRYMMDHYLDWTSHYPGPLSCPETNMRRNNECNGDCPSMRFSFSFFFILNLSQLSWSQGKVKCLPYWRGSRQSEVPSSTVAFWQMFQMLKYIKTGIEVKAVTPSQASMKMYVSMINCRGKSRNMGYRGGCWSN